MKKTLTVNLNNIVFHIDDDAYEMLQTYLSEIADHFQSDEEKKDIMNDIEARIAELFSEKLQKNKNVINLSDVQEIIEIMGKPSQYADEDEEPKAPKSEKKTKHSRRFYRDPENAILGGIASGLSSYIGLDVTIIRIILVLLVLIGWGLIIPIYLIVWLVAPQALTASQRLEMQGEDVTVDSIKTELNNVKNYVESDKFKQSASSVGEKLLDVFRIILKFVFGIVGAALGIAGVVLVGALILLLFLLIFDPGIINSFAPEVFADWAVISPEKMVMLVISLLLIVGCPIFLLIYWAIRLINHRKNNSQTASWVVLILWLAGLFMFYSVGANTIIKFNKANSTHSYSIDWNDDSSNYVDEVRNCEPFNSIDISGNIKLTLTQDSIQQVTISSPVSFLPKIKTKVENGILKIYSDKIYINRTIKARVSAQKINSLIAKGACNIATDSQIVTEDLSVELIGASQGNMDVNVSGTFDVEAKGASQLKLRGTCDTFKVDCIGASEIKAQDLKAKYAKIEATGASEVKLYATESIDAEATGASEITCNGNPKKVKKSSRFGSTIRIK